MTERNAKDTLLGGFRALDLTGEKGLLCGKLLAELGVDVIKIERPGGDPARRIGPFYQDCHDPEKSLFWFAYSINKRSITLDISNSRGKELFGRLVKKSDFVIESFPPGYLDDLGLGYAKLSNINKRIILTSITPFGQSGPYRDYKGPDIVVMALSGYMYPCGDTDRPPVRISFPQAYLNASAQAAAASLIAHYWREKTGEGQHVDVCAQEGMAEVMIIGAQTWDLRRVVDHRSGPLQPTSRSAFHRVHWRCKDGFVAFYILGGKMGARTNRALVAWMDERGFAPDFLKDTDWEGLDHSKTSTADFERLEEPIARFFLAHTKAELYEGALKWGLMFCPMNTASDMLADEQLEYRNFWAKIPHPELGVNLIYPGAYVKSTETEMKIASRAPFIGEHNEQIYLEELGLTKLELENLKRDKVV